MLNFINLSSLQPKGEDGTYFQPFELNATVTDSLVYNTYRADSGDTLFVNQSVEVKNSNTEFVRGIGGAGPIEGDIVFGGFGVDDSLNGVRNLDGDAIANNWVLIFEQIPYVVDDDTLVSTNYTGRDRLITLIRDYGARGILLIPDQTENEFNEMAAMNSQTISVPENLELAYRGGGRGSYTPPYAYTFISPEFAAEILNVDNEQGLEELRQNTVENLQNFRSEKTSYYLEYTPYEGQKTIETNNVLAYFEGADPELKDEVVVVMGHYDHVGLGSPNEEGDYIYNGADDNGSGTAGLMAIANTFQEAAQDGYKPKRSILFLHVSAEESGLLGSRYYSDHPVIPIEQTVAALNTDMISRSDPEHIEDGNTDYVYLIGGEIISSQLDSLVQDANQKSVNMTLDRGYNDLNDPNQFYRRSDHWNFGRLRVPFVFFFTGVHEDYHQPSDHIEDVDFEKFPRVVQLIYNSAVNIANFEGRPQVDNEEFIEITSEQSR
ncbi:MAG: M20/M25/M40 family metallo-hydrolase [Balneolaceae bacterium]|nr:M20/M25/M40 family metallo-hydrolase [Balneolaceae bacterium]